MEKSLILTILCIGVTLFDTGHGFPIEISSIGTGSDTIWSASYLLPGISFTLILVGVVLGCLCCRNNTGFKEFSNSSGSLEVSRDGMVNTAVNSELTIFPPLGSSSTEICRFEPLPDIRLPAGNLRPAAFSYAEQEISSQDWFFEPYSNFPRNQLKYVQEFGRGWFGRVVEGEAQNIVPYEKVTKAMVKILHEDATPTDQMYFLHEVKFYRDLKHPNILRLLGRCLETEPFLIILECYPNGDLKTFLSQNLASALALVEQGVTLQMCANITSGLQFMHQNKFVHTDLAARNCLVAPDLTVKIGDYGNSIEIFNTDYYCAGSVALPVRWCAPETLKCTDVTIETREVTQPANIWSLGIVFWEICEFCKLPYAELNDDQVIVHVLGEKNYFLEKPKMVCLYKDELYHLMKLCWNQPLHRPTASQIVLILNNLISSNKVNHKDTQHDSKRLSQNFEERWQNLKPNSIPKKDYGVTSEYSANCGLITTKIKNAKVVDSSLVESPLGIFMSNKNTGQEAHRVCLTSDGDPPKKPKTESEEKRISANHAKSETASKNVLQKVEFRYSGEGKEEHILKSGINFKGTTPEVDSWLKGLQINNEEDESFIWKISEAIRDLDEALALERTSSSEENSGKCSQRNSPGKEAKEHNEPVVDFKLGSDTSSFLNFTQKSFEISSLQNTEQPQSLNFADSFIEEKKDDTKNELKNYDFYESLKENDSLTCGQSRNSSDTDDETWRRRIERGEISEKVKEKSKSIADLMVLTHIDSDDSDMDLYKPLDKSLIRSSFSRRSGSFTKSSCSNNFGSENDLAHAVLEEDFKESLKRLSNDHKEHGHFDSLGVILLSSVNKENVWESFFKPSEALDKIESAENTNKIDSMVVGQPSEPKIENLGEKNTDNFLGDIASEKVNEKSGKFVTDERQIEIDAFKNFNENINILKKDILVEESSCRVNVSGVSVDKSSSQLKRSSLEDSCNSENPRELENESPCRLEGNEMSSVYQIKQNILKKPDSAEMELKASNKKEVAPEIRMTEREKESPDNFEEVFADIESKCRPLKFVLKDDWRSCPSLGETPTCDFDEKTFDPVEGAAGRLGECYLFGAVDDLGGKRVESNSENVPSDEATVIMGACEAFTLDYFKGLKTTSEDVNAGELSEEEDNISKIMEEMGRKEANFDAWGEHLEKSFTNQLKESDLDDVKFRSSGAVWDEGEAKALALKEKKCEISLGIIAEFIEAEKMHTEKVEESIHLNRVTSLTVVPSEEEYENFKLRTPDDERSSDSGFRDKGSLSESVEDACEGKYNLEDIEAELEEAYVKGVFGNRGAEKENEDSKNFSNFEFEEAKFYEDENRNEEDYSDIDGEIDFWQNKDDSDYYPEISEFSATCSQGWYLHPPEENTPTIQSNVNEDLVNALRNELRESLPVQARSFNQFNDFFEAEIKEAKKDLNIHYGGDFGLPLSPITEEQSISQVGENDKNSLFDGIFPNKCRKNMTNLMESAKAIDTNTFKQYLDYMIENEGRDFGDSELTEEETDDGEKKMMVEREERIRSGNGFEEETKKASGVEGGSRSDSSLSDANENGVVVFLEELESDSVAKKVLEMNREDLLIVNTDTDEAKLLETPRPKSFSAFAENAEAKQYFADAASDCSENDGLIFTPELLSPEKERSLSEISRSSNGTRTGDALSDITMSSPDLIPDYFASAQETLPSNEAKEIMDELKGSGIVAKIAVFGSSDPTQEAGSKDLILAKDGGFDGGPREEAKKVINRRNETEVNDTFEMSTSFMESDKGEDLMEESDVLKLKQSSRRRRSAGGEYWSGGWDSDGSADEELSSSSGEFIWKEGDKESKVRVARAGDCDVENSLNETSKSNSTTEVVSNEFFAGKSNASKEGTRDGEEMENEDEEEEEEEDEDESSTESSASITDFVPSAWNSQATPSRSALRSPLIKKEQQKKSVWFKKQKYHCVYEYPREPSDDEDVDGSTFTMFAYDKTPSDLQHFFDYDVGSFEPPNQFPLGTSKITSYSSYPDWDIADEDKGFIDPPNSKIDFQKTDLDFSNDVSFFNRNPFDYDFNNAGVPESKNEFLVSSSSRPFHGNSIGKLQPGNDRIFDDDAPNNEKPKETETKNCYDFATPDSGLEDSSQADLNSEQTPPDFVHSFDSRPRVLQAVGDSKPSNPPDLENVGAKKARFDSSLVLGELRYARGRLKLDLPHNHNIDLGAVVGRNDEQ